MFRDSLVNVARSTLRIVLRLSKSLSSSDCLNREDKSSTAEVTEGFSPRTVSSRLNISLRSLTNVTVIGQHPDVFCAAVMRNPVISAGELCTSDIPDWALREFGFSFEPGTHVTPEIFSALHAASPIAHVARVKAPVLILLGEDDLRVPPTQGRGYYHVLKGMGRVVELLVFPKETHPIDGVEAARVAFEAGRDWFRTFTQEK